MSWHETNSRSIICSIGIYFSCHKAHYPQIPSIIPITCLSKKGTRKQNRCMEVLGLRCKVNPYIWAHKAKGLQLSGKDKRVWMFDRIKNIHLKWIFEYVHLSKLYLDNWMLNQNGKVWLKNTKIWNMKNKKEYS